MTEIGRELRAKKNDRNWKRIESKEEGPKWEENWKQRRRTEMRGELEAKNDRNGMRIGSKEGFAMMTVIYFTISSLY